MTTPATGTTPPVERRQPIERRRDGDHGRRGQRPPSPAVRTAQMVVSYIFGIVALLCVIVFAAMSTKPIFARHETVTQELAKRGAAAAQAAEAKHEPIVNDSLTRDSLFQRDRKAFAEDMVRHGHITPERADTVAYFAVREAYQYGIPPALIFGLMLTENSTFISRAKSNVGAVGLMQVYPKVWLKSLSKKFGRDLASDSTNVKYGAFILSTYLKPRKGQVPSVATLRKGLLGYNGCVRGTNTPNCHTYPSKIQGYIEREAQSLCGGKGFDECITKPFVRGLLGEDTEVASRTD